MADDTDRIAELSARIEALEQLVSALKGRIDDLEAAEGGVRPAYHIADDEQTV